MHPGDSLSTNNGLLHNVAMRFGVTLPDQIPPVEEMPDNLMERASLFGRS